MTVLEAFILSVCHVRLAHQLGSAVHESASVEVTSVALAVREGVVQLRDVELLVEHSVQVVQARWPSAALARDVVQHVRRVGDGGKNTAKTAASDDVHVQSAEVVVEVFNLDTGDLNGAGGHVSVGGQLGVDHDTSSSLAGSRLDSLGWSIQL
jgi:hypothetical protein